jgi:transposase-like protein
VYESSYREVIALDLGEAETEALWRSFPRCLVERGLGHAAGRLRRPAALKQAIAQVLGCPWQRFSVHFLREALGQPTASSRCWPRSCAARRRRQLRSGARAWRELAGGRSGGDRGP